MLLILMFMVILYLCYFTLHICKPLYPIRPSRCKRTTKASGNKKSITITNFIIATLASYHFLYSQPTSLLTSVIKQPTSLPKQTILKQKYTLQKQKSHTHPKNAPPQLERLSVTSMLHTSMGVCNSVSRVLELSRKLETRFAPLITSGLKGCFFSS